jgi:hypothetical protein
MWPAFGRLVPTKMPGGDAAIVDRRKLTVYCRSTREGSTRRVCSRRSDSLLRTLTNYERRY